MECLAQRYNHEPGCSGIGRANPLVIWTTRRATVAQMTARRELEEAPAVLSNPKLKNEPILKMDGCNFVLFIFASTSARHILTLLYLRYPFLF